MITKNKVMDMAREVSGDQDDWEEWRKLVLGFEFTTTEVVFEIVPVSQELTSS